MRQQVSLWPALGSKAGTGRDGGAIRPVGYADVEAHFEFPALAECGRLIFRHHTSTIARLTAARVRVTVGDNMIRVHGGERFANDADYTSPH
jgi:hypothetical protein